MSGMSITRDSSFPTGFISSDLLGLESGGPTDMEDGEIVDNPRAPEPMDQTEGLGHGVHPTGSPLSDVSVIPGGVSDLPSEDMNTTAHPSESESHSSQPTTSQGARHSQSGPRDSAWGEEGDEASQHCCLYPKTRPYVIPQISRVSSGWYDEEECLDPTEVASPFRRVGKPNLHGSIGGHKAHTPCLLTERTGHTPTIKGSWSVG